MLNELSAYVKKVLIPTKLAPIRRLYGKRELAILDVGCGNDSYEITKRWLNVKSYHGVDKEYWHGRENDYRRMDHIYFVDLDEPDSLKDIPKSSYDVIIMNHVIEHLSRGYEVIANLYEKLSPGGVLYIETPSERTVNYPSAIGFLNFYDDPTHRKIYPVMRLVEVAMEAGFKVLRFGVRRDWKRVFLLSPLAILWNLLISLPFRRKIDARGLWDLLGVANYVFARKP
jgi:SAM-dependent methyltransferase